MCQIVHKSDFLFDLQKFKISAILVIYGDGEFCLFVILTFQYFYFRFTTAHIYQKLCSMSRNHI